MSFVYIENWIFVFTSCMHSVICLFVSSPQPLHHPSHDYSRVLVWDCEYVHYLDVFHAIVKRFHLFSHFQWVRDVSAATLSSFWLTWPHIRCPTLRSNKVDQLATAAPPPSYTCFGPLFFIPQNCIDSKWNAVVAFSSTVPKWHDENWNFSSLLLCAHVRLRVSFRTWLFSERNWKIHFHM